MSRPPQTPFPPPRLEILGATPGLFPTIAELAHRIWPICFSEIISPAQCEYMLHQRYTPTAIAESIRLGMAYELLRSAGTFVGFGAHGPGPSPRDWKLWQIYLLPDRQGLGLGRQYIDHVVHAGRRAGRSILLLTVNKANARARALYERCGFQIRESVTFDIGNGFLMDDFVLVKPLEPAPQTDSRGMPPTAERLDHHPE